MSTVHIGYNTVDIIKFAWDRCHKIYLLRNEDELNELTELGYDIYDPEQLSDVWNRSCGLRFISSGDLTEQYIKQGDSALITIDTA